MERPKHHDYAPSSYPAWEKCPHWESANTKEMQDAAVIGTFQHKALADVLSGKDFDELGDYLQSDDVIIPVRRAVRGIKEFLEQQMPGAESRTMLCEVMVDANCYFPLDVYGTADVVVFRKDGTGATDADHLIVIDYKSRYTDKTYWEQLAFYAYAFSLSVSPLGDRTFKYATLAVWYGDEGTIETMDVTLDRAYAIALHALANRLNREQMPRKASAWCSLCKHCGVCPQAFSLVQKAYAILPANAEGNIEPHMLPQMMDIAREVKKRIYSLDEYAKQVALEHGGVLADASGKPIYIYKECNMSKLQIQPFFDAVRKHVSASKVLEKCTLTKQAARELLRDTKKEDGKYFTLKEADEIIRDNSSPALPSYKITRAK